MSNARAKVAATEKVLSIQRHARRHRARISEMRPAAVISDHQARGAPAKSSPCWCSRSAPQRRQITLPTLKMAGKLWRCEARLLSERCLALASHAVDVFEACTDSVAAQILGQCRPQRSGVQRLQSSTHSRRALGAYRQHGFSAKQSHTKTAWPVANSMSGSRRGRARSPPPAG